MAIDENVKYGNTSPVKNCSEAHGVPVEHGYVVADYILHGRTGYWQTRARDWLAENLGPQHQVDFFNDVSSITARISG